MAVSTGFTRITCECRLERGNTIFIVEDFTLLLRMFLGSAKFRDISLQVLGYWFWWLFIVPSLRSRRPKGQEKKALDIAFLGTPLISILAPSVTKDTGLIWMGK